uniref:Uncharacterized protein n=1 Tax=Fagus sylvatica TaxID=28930 RepID=A0A2N9FI32_FAGSY
MEKKEASARMSGLRRKEGQMKNSISRSLSVGINSMYPDSRVKWYAIEFLDPESRRYLYSSSARRKEKENVDVRLIPYSSSARRKEKENVDVRLIPYSSSARRKEKENVDVCKYKKLPYSSFSAKNSPNQDSMLENTRSRASHVFYVEYRRPVTVGNTLYWAFLDRTYSRFGSVDTGGSDQKFCLLLESCTMCKNPPEFDTKYVNFLVLDIDMHMPDDDHDDDDDESVYHKLSVSVRSVQKHILGGAS